MKLRPYLGILFLFLSFTTRGQDISLDDLVYFQTIKNSVKIDSVLLTKPNWNCDCYRDDGQIEFADNWIYDISDTTKENLDKDYIRFDKLGHGFSSIITFYTNDRRKADVILNEMTERKFPEEKIQTYGVESLSARISFFVSDKFAVQTVIGEDKIKGTGKYAFIIMDKDDYLKDLKIK